MSLVVTSMICRLRRSENNNMYEDWLRNISDCEVPDKCSSKSNIQFVLALIEVFLAAYSILFEGWGITDISAPVSTNQRRPDFFVSDYESFRGVMPIGRFVPVGL